MCRKNTNNMNKTHTPEEIAAAIKETIKQKYGSLNVYAQEKRITPTQLYTLLNGKEYLSLFSAIRFSTDLDINIDYCTKGTLPIFTPEHDYNLLLEAATAFYYAVRDEDKAREEYERMYESMSTEEQIQFKTVLERLRIDKAKAGCALVDLLNVGWEEEKTENPENNESNESHENDENRIEKPIIPKNTMKLHEAIQEVLCQSKRPLTFTEIAKEINAKKLYTRKDGMPIPASQISARVNKYPKLFTLVPKSSPITIMLNK